MDFPSRGFRLRFPQGGLNHRRVRGLTVALSVFVLLPSLMITLFQASVADVGVNGRSPAPYVEGATGNSSDGDVVVGARTDASATPDSAAAETAVPSMKDRRVAVALDLRAELAQEATSDIDIAATRPTPNDPTKSNRSKPKPTQTPNPTAPPAVNPAPPVAPPPAPVAPAPVVPVPPAGTSLALGVWSGQPWEPGNLDALTNMLGRAPGIFLTYQGWDRGFHASDMAQISNRGASHVVTWEPNGITLRSIASGSHDAFIRSWARGAAGWGGSIYLRPMHEMNGSWYSWGRGVNGNTPADFVNAWRRMHDLFVAEGAFNVKWVWSPNVRYGPEYPLADLYPGAAYVDWLGLDGYNWGMDPHLGQPAWQSFEDIFGATYREVTALAPGKPLMIVETASTENGGNKAQWILNTYLNDVPRYPAVRAVIWFNQADGPSNFRLDSSAAALAAFKQVMNSGAYPGLLP